ncbi:MAG: hypothetical protein IJ626_04300 [Muribaculaceae bacterium]|nr:hypothetical protein [Muribaculaceae bacterium]
MAGFAAAAAVETFGTADVGALDGATRTADTAYVANEQAAMPKVLLETDRETWYEMGDSILVVPKRKPNFFQKIVKYILTDKDHSKDRLWMSFLGGPHYDTDTKLGLAVMGNAYFRLKSCDLASQPSWATLRLDFSISGYVSVRLSGNTLIANDKRRFNYEAEFESLPSYYWGIGYDECDLRSNENKMTRKQAHFQGDFLWRVAPKFYLGPAVHWNWVKAKEIVNMDLMDGQPLCVRSYGFGFTADYDGRDVIVNAERGLYAHAGVLFYPKKLWNDFAFTRLDARVCWYHSLWRNAIIATELRGQFNIGNPSWAMMAQPGDSYNLRGYFKGRYRDKHSLALQAEVRQRIWNRLGAVVWGGCGTVFHDASGMKKLLPNVGIGLRWEFRKRLNVRVDYGWGRSGEHGFIFAMGEAF